MQEIKYYLYLSKVKVEMLWGQINQNDMEKLTTEMKISLGFFSGGVKSEAKDETIYSQLNLILAYLESKKLIGTIQDPKTFFRGSIPMTFQELNFYRGENDGKMVLFSGCDFNNKCLIGLVGSTSHITGMNHIEPASLGYAQQEFWMKIQDELIPPNETQLMNEMYDLDNMIHYQAIRRKDGPPKQNLEFVAKTFVSKEGFLLGSPIYVAEQGLL